MIMDKRNKHIGIVLEAFPRLAETFISNEILMLERMGFKLHIFALRNPGEPRVHDSVLRLRARVTYIPDRFWRYCGPFIRASLKLLWRHPKGFLHALGIASTAAFKSGGLRVLKRFAQAVYLTQNCLTLGNASQSTDNRNDENIDDLVEIVHFHAHFSHYPATVAWFAAELAGKSFSISAHSTTLCNEHQRLLMEKFLRARFVVTCTNSNKERIHAIMGGNSPVLCSFHGTDLHLFSSSYKPTSEIPVILSVGRLVPHKGFTTLIEALRLLHQQGMIFRGIIIGQGPMENELNRCIAAAGLHHVVEILPVCPQRELLNFYLRASVFVFAGEQPAVGDRDGIPNVIVEAMAMGIAVVTTDVAGISECVTDTVDGLMIPQQNPTALAAALRTLLEQPHLAQEFGSAARLKVEREFNAYHNCRQIAMALRDAIPLEYRDEVAALTPPTSEAAQLQFMLENLDAVAPIA